MRKDELIDGNEHSEVVKDYNNFLTKMDDLKPYIVKFEENSKMKPKVYPFNCAIGDNDWQSIIIFIYDEYTFFANNGI